MFYFEARSPEKVSLELVPVGVVCQPRHLTGFDNRAFISYQWVQTRQTLWVDFLRVLTNRSRRAFKVSRSLLFISCSLSICALFGTSLGFLSLRIPNPEKVSLLFFFFPPAATEAENIMNIFRLAGDVSHLVAIVILLMKIWWSKSCAGMKLTSLHFKCDWFGPA